MRIVPHLTAIQRKSPSVPLRTALNQGFIDPKDRVLDYGCGRGFDVRYLQEQGYRAEGYDPFYQPEIPTGIFDFCLCSYVLNVIPEPAERDEVLKNLYHYRGRVMTTVRSKQQVEKLALQGNWEPYNDGYVTPKNTFQRGFTSDELEKLHKETGFIDVRTIQSRRDSVSVIGFLVIADGE